MYDTRLKSVSARRESLEAFLGHYLFGPQGYAINQPTAARLVDRLPSGLSTDIYRALEKIPAGDDPIDQLIAPAVRCVDDFRRAGGGVLTRTVEGWTAYENPLFDAATALCPTGLVTVQINDVQRLTQDPRIPSLWPEPVYAMIQNRPRMGSGNFDRIARIATCAIALSWFSETPHIPEVSITGTLRHFVLMGANKPR